MMTTHKGNRLPKLKVPLFWDMMQFRLAQRCKHIGVTFCLRPQGIPKHYPDDGNKVLRNVRTSGTIFPVHSTRSYNTEQVQLRAFSTSALDGQLHAPDASSDPGKVLPVPNGQKAGWASLQNPFAPAGNRTEIPPIP